MQYKRILCILLSASLLYGSSLTSSAAEVPHFSASDVISTESTDSLSFSVDDSSASDSVLSDFAQPDEGSDATGQISTGNEQTLPVAPEENFSTESEIPDGTTDSIAEDTENATEAITEVEESEVVEEAPLLRAVAIPPTVLSQNECKQIIFDYLTNTAGFNSAVACGIMANIQQECGFIPTNVGDAFEKAHGFTDATYTAGVDNGSYTNFIHDGTGYGLCQWTYWSAKRDLLAYAQARNSSIGNLYTQLGFLVESLSTYNVLKYLSNIPNTAEGAYQAAYNFCSYYERPSNTANSSVQRGNIARYNYWPVYGTGSKDDSVQTDPSLPNSQTGIYLVTASSLSVRSGPDTSFSRLGYIGMSSEVSVTAVSDGWGKISFNGSVGWISLSYCQLIKPDSVNPEQPSTPSQPSNPEQPSASASYKITASSLNVRSSGNNTSAIIGVLKKDALVSVVSVEEGWGKIVYNGQTGYISMKYCEKVSDSPVTTTESTTTTTTESTTTTTAPTTTTTTQPPTTTTTQPPTTTTTQPQGAVDQPSAIGKYKVTASSLNVRSGAGTSYSKIGTLYNGSIVDVLLISDGWAKINYQGKTGYVSMSYLVETENASTTTTEATTTTTTETTTTTTEATTTTTTQSTPAGTSAGIYKTITSLNVRSGPDGSYSILGVLANGEQISVSSISNGWAKFTYKGQTAYASAKYLTFVKEEAPAIMPLALVRQPENCTVAKEGDNARISVVATGTGLTYQWYYRNAGYTAFSKSSITDSSYVTPVISARNGRQIYCVVTDQEGNSIRTNTVSMNILGTMVILSQPKSVVVAKEGAYASFTVEAVGDGINYTWYYKDTKDSVFRKSSVVGNTYRYPVIEARNNRQVYCVVSDLYGNTFQTNIVVMSYTK